MTSLAAEIVDLERRGWEALKAGGGAQFYEEVMAEDGLMVFPGSVMDKAASIDAIANAPPWATFELADARVIEATPENVIVTYRATAQRTGDPVYRAMMSSSYARRDGRWRLVLHQQTPE